VALGPTASSWRAVLLVTRLDRLAGSRRGLLNLLARPCLVSVN
jgi:hypothetical protein